MCVGDDNKWRFVGMVFNTFCEQEGAMHAFIRISSFQTFIEQSIAVDAGENFFLYLF